MMQSVTFGIGWWKRILSFEKQSQKTTLQIDCSIEMRAGTEGHSSVPEEKPEAKDASVGLF